MYLDGADTGSVTPATLKNVAAGTHTVKCSMTGYSTGSQTVTVTGGQHGIGEAHPPVRHAGNRYNHGELGPKRCLDMD